MFTIHRYAERIKVAGILVFLINRLGVDWLTRMIKIFSFLSLNGWQMQLIPTYGCWTRLWTVIPLLPAALALVWTPVGATYRGSRVGCFVGRALTVVSLLSALLLLLALPSLDSLGIRGSFQWALLSALADW